MSKKISYEELQAEVERLQRTKGTTQERIFELVKSYEPNGCTLTNTEIGVKINRDPQIVSDGIRKLVLYKRLTREQYFRKLKIIQ